jgi:DNA-binding protein
LLLVELVELKRLLEVPLREQVLLEVQQLLLTVAVAVAGKVLGRETMAALAVVVAVRQVALVELQVVAIQMSAEQAEVQELLNEQVVAVVLLLLEQLVLLLVMVALEKSQLTLMYS